MTDDFPLVEHAIALLSERAESEAEAAESSIAGLASRLGVGQAALVRAFRACAGLGPKQFQQVIGVSRAGLSLARMSVLAAALDAGMSGPGRLHDRCVRIEAMTPGALRHQGEGVVFRHGSGTTPLGPAGVVWTDVGIHRLVFGSYREAELRAAWPRAALVADPLGAQAVLAKVFSVHAPAGSFRIQMIGTPFQIAVWRALLAIPEGETRTYQAIAAAIGRPQASRAVGTAIGANPIAVLIPCHRVIRTCGALGGYRWGLARKACLLARECGEGGLG